MDVPTDEPPQTPTPTDTQFLPRQCVPVTSIGFENASAIGAAHNATVWNTSFTVRRIETRNYQDGTLAKHTVLTAQVPADHNRLYLIGRV